MPKLKNFIKIIDSVDNWYWYLLDFWLGKKGEYMYKTRDGNKFIINTGSDDRYIFNEIYIHKIYTPFKINETDIVVDIGAHKGIFSLYASKIAKKGKIFAFEPMKENFSALKRHAMINKCRNLSIFNLAVSDKSGKLKFYISKNKEYSGRHSLYIFPKEAKEEIVKSTTLAGIIKDNNLKKIDFLKLDCEGAEYGILFKSSKNTLKKIKKISMEYHDMNEKNNNYSLKNFLEANGFSIVVKDKESLMFAYKK